MGSKCKVIVGKVLLLLILLSFILMYIMWQQKDENYCNKIISILREQEKITVQDIFSFEFEKGYIFNDCYISGEGFAERYDLDIAIGQVKAGSSENIQRIVFVDKQGFFVYEFKCDSSNIVILEKGIVIYPETIIERKSSIVGTPETNLMIYFNSSEHYDY